MGLAAKMVLIMGEITYLEKDARNNFHKYPYTSDTQVYHAVRQAMIKHGVAVFTKMLQVEQAAGETAGGKPNMHTLARFIFVLVDAESGEREECAWYGEADDQTDKGVNKCGTAALKYFLLKTFVIPTGDDPDSGAAEPTQRKNTTPATAPATPIATRAEAENVFDAGARERMAQYMVDQLMAVNEYEASGRIRKAINASRDGDPVDWAEIYDMEYHTTYVWELVQAYVAAKAETQEKEG